MKTKLTFYDDPVVFLEDARPLLEADPVVTSVLGTVTTWAASERAAGTNEGDGRDWWVLVSEDGDVASAAMQVGKGHEIGMLVLAMSGPASEALANALIERRRIPPGVNGALPAARTLAEALAFASGKSMTVSTRTRLHVLEDLKPPQGVRGELRRVEVADLPTVTPWFERFEQEAAQQAGRTVESTPIDAHLLRRKIEEGLLWLWVVEGEAVHLTGHNPPVHGVVRIGPVYTPGEHRSKGYAGAAVAGVSQHLLDAGHRVCLYTDLDNPRSNRVYARIGFSPVVDQANHRLVEIR